MFAVMLLNDGTPYMFFNTPLGKGLNEETTAASLAGAHIDIIVSLSGLKGR